MSGTRSSNLLGKITILVMVVLCVNTAMALDGSGTQENPWRIQSLDDFNDFAADANYWDGWTRLETDVNLAGLTYTTAVIAPDTNSSASRFQGTAFTGVFDGSDHKITDLTIDDGGAGNDYLGLFGCIDEGEVMNLGIEGGFVSGEYNVGGLVGGNFGIVSNCYCTGFMSGYSCVGGLVGKNGFVVVVHFPTTSEKAGYIYNSYSTGSVQGDSLVGGLVGLVRKGDVSNCCSISDVNGFDSGGGLVGVNLGIVSNCYAAGDVNSVSTVGGLVGRNGVHSGGYPGTDPGYIYNSYSTGAVQGNSHVGGLVGQNHFGTVSNCYATGSVRGDWVVGGLVGVIWIGTVSNCYATGDVNGVDDVGGLVGMNGHRNSVSNCYSTGSVSGTNDVGGLVGSSRGSITNCYSIGDVNGINEVGGLVGKNWEDSSVSSCFWDTDTQTHGVTESIGLDQGTVTNVSGLTTAEMRTRSTFTDADWDFINTWAIGENQTYPYLRVYLAGDINKDGIVNFLDLSITANQWMEED